MLTGYEKHLSEVLGKTQEELKKAVDDLGWEKYRYQKAKEDKEMYYNSYMEYMRKNNALRDEIKELEQKLEALKKEEEQDEATSYSEDNLKEAI